MGVGVGVHGSASGVWGKPRRELSGVQAKELIAELATLHLADSTVRRWLQCVSVFWIVYIHTGRVRCIHKGVG